MDPVTFLIAITALLIVLVLAWYALRRSQLPEPVPVVVLLVIVLLFLYFVLRGKFF